MLAITRCAACGITGATWGHPTVCIGCIDAFEKPHANRKLTDAQVVAVRAERSAGATYGALSRRYGVAKGTIQPLIAGRTYRDVGVAA